MAENQDLGLSTKSNKQIQKAVIVSKVYHRPVGGAIEEIAAMLRDCCYAHALGRKAICRSEYGCRL